MLHIKLVCYKNIIIKNLWRKFVLDFFVKRLVFRFCSKNNNNYWLPTLLKHQHFIKKKM